MNGAASASSVRKRAVIGLQLTMAVLIVGCGFRTLKKDLHVIEETAVLEGQARVQGAGGDPIVVVVHSTATNRIADLFLLPRPGPFFFVLSAGGYQLAAFEDRNRDLSYQPEEEPAAVVTDLVLRPGEHRADVVLAIDPNSRARIPFAASGLSPGQREVEHFPALQIGTLVAMDDPRFSDENAKIGLWDPLRFLFEVGAGVYFLEEYDPEKTPVLFVHGAMGHPGNWTHLVGTLDRSRFQPWLLYYPTAPHLDRVAQGLVRTLASLQVKYRFPRLILVAHSMGGLVTRAALNFAMQHAAHRRVVEIPAFISISSPWNGHSAAAEGVEYSPVVAPSWEDMAPGSPFLTGLPKTPLPPECEYTLLFSYHGSASFSGEANDGTVAVSSELSMPIQQQAAHVRGFDETHTSILANRDVAALVSGILNRASVAQP